MKRSTLTFALFFILPLVILAQSEKKFNAQFYGFVKTDIFYDSRQVVAVRDGHFLLYPRAEKLDNAGKDINAKSSFNMLSIQTRVGVKITAPDALGAKITGLVEGAFFGMNAADIDGFRLRHAFVKMQWKSTALLVGQYWHPNFVTKCFPGTVSFNTGAPFTPFTRNPQIRITQQAGNFYFIGTILSQVDFVSNGPIGPNSIYLRNSVLPALNLRIEYYSANKEKDREFLIGASANFKRLIPRVSSDVFDTITDQTYTYKGIEEVSSLSGMLYFKVKVPAITIKAAGTYAQDAFNWTMLGGYAVEKIVNPVKGFQEYTPISTLAAWTDIHSNGKKWQVGLFAGYTKNLGSDKNITGAYYSRGSSIDHVYRISPRFIYNINRFRIAPEIEYTVAAYGTPNELGEVENTTAVGNVRLLLGVYLFF
ncbi:MAG: hypothetical protein U9R60_13360 [Bacteroidota bacterium]|nr:hypothetical protein [Bacteroidota bacterium]